MGRGHEEVELPGVDGKFTILQLEPEASYWLLLDIAAVVAPSASKSLQGAPSLDLGKLDIGTIGEALEGLFRRSNRDEVKRITKELFSSIEWVGNGTKLPVAKHLNTIFAGNPLGILLLQKEALRVNYTVFFKGLGALVREAVTKAQGKRSAASGTSGGPSGDSSLSASQP